MKTTVSEHIKQSWNPHYKELRNEKFLMQLFSMGEFYTSHIIRQAWISNNPIPRYANTLNILRKLLKDECT